MLILVSLVHNLMSLPHLVPSCPLSIPSAPTRTGHHVFDLESAAPEHPGWRRLALAGMLWLKELLCLLLWSLKWYSPELFDTEGETNHRKKKRFEIALGMKMECECLILIQDTWIWMSSTKKNKGKQRSLHLYGMNNISLLVTKMKLWEVKFPVAHHVVQKTHL